ncbi:MAG: short-chain dehydrogenase [Alphaproteobacteria bacterium]|nr:MAG: short-chain dehydrogenase [Alphaproteobacteria bacterium]
MVKFSNKDIILVTGASSGIGRAVCEELNSRGAFVIAAARNMERLEQLKENSKYPAQMTVEYLDVEENTNSLNRWVLKLAKKYGKLRGIALIAGIQHIVPLSALKPSKMEELLNVNVMANLWLAKGFCDRRANIGRGSSVVFMSSISAITGEAGLTAYSTTKGALNSLMRSLAKEVAPSGIRVNSILPGLVQTGLLKKWDAVYTKEYLSETELKYPLGLGKPEDIAGPVAFLLSDDSSWITGVELVADGGATL